ncbi:MAG: 2,3-diphosphoglycerate-dependent phosphoglycerate mutase [Pseudomonadota bacterium]
MKKLTLVRHGQSQWNLENRFTGWVDAPLTEKGMEEAQAAGQKILAAGLSFDFAFTSVLQRAIRTLWFILQESDQVWVPVEKHWRLNERHYGGLQGLNKQETRDKYGDEQVFQWRRSYKTPPPPASGEFQDQQLKDRRYSQIDPKDFPSGEALFHTLERVKPYWIDQMLPVIQSSQSVLVAAHGNSLRALVKLLTDMSDDEITKFEFATGVPLVCELDDQFKVASMDWLR